MRKGERAARLAKVSEKSSLDVSEGVEKPLSSGWPLLGPCPRQCSPASPSAAESRGRTPHSSGAFLPTQNSCGLACALEKGEAECKANLLAGSSPCRVAAALAFCRQCFCARPVPEAAPGSPRRMRSDWAGVAGSERATGDRHHPSDWFGVFSEVTLRCFRSS